MTNHVSYAGNIKGMEKRLEYAMNEQAKAMTRRSVSFMAKTLLDAGFILD